ncbi:hypothetical protein MLD38_038920 [Melastoma candidum]|uniref:Uncharacterized protein n=1 Tax=Melastoma candidum TaxID=119954 RepID=A0ACB9L153_9MYRT|nr:hypothetical protein MLD38_038920 [Melastoma candidum]
MSTAPVKPPHHHHHHHHHQQQQQQQPPPQQQRQHQHQHHHHHQHQQPLHNFSLPSFLKWPSSNGSGRVRREPQPPRTPASPNRSNGVGRAEGNPNSKKEGLDGEGSVEGEDGRKPWNLRPRRGPMATAAAAAAAAVGARNGEHEGGAGNRSRRNGDGGEHKKEEKEEGKKKRRLWIALTKEEIEEDVFIMTGCRPSRRPKKRNRTEQKQLDCVFPGLWLVGTTADVYRVAETPAKR